MDDINEILTNACTDIGNLKIVKILQSPMTTHLSFSNWRSSLFQMYFTFLLTKYLHVSYKLITLIIVNAHNYQTWMICQPKHIYRTTCKQSKQQPVYIPLSTIHVIRNYRATKLGQRPHIIKHFFNQHMIRRLQEKLLTGHSDLIKQSQHHTRWFNRCWNKAKEQADSNRMASSKAASSHRSYMYATYTNTLKTLLF